MLHDLKTAASRDPLQIATDFAGVAALLVILLAGLSLPGAF